MVWMEEREGRGIRIGAGQLAREQPQSDYWPVKCENVEFHRENFNCKTIWHWLAKSLLMNSLFYCFIRYIDFSFQQFGRTPILATAQFSAHGGNWMI
jgi:hypothetical protein